jgi:hypothetical protein
MATEAHADPILFELEVRGFLPYTSDGPHAGHTTAALFKKGDARTPNDLVLVVDRTNPDALDGDAGAPHRTTRAVRPFALPTDEVLGLASRIPHGFFSPLRRVTILEVGEGPPTADDLSRLDAYRSPPSGPLLVGAAYVDTASKTVHANDGASAYATGLAFAEDPSEIARRALGAAPQDGALGPGIALFSTKAVGVTAFLLSPLAAAALLAHNLWKTRRPALGAALFAATFAALLVFVLALSEAPSAVSAPLGIGGLFVMTRLSHMLFGEPLRKAGFGLGAGLSLASLVVFLGVTFGIGIAYDAVSHAETTLSNGARVVHERGVSEADAKKVGESLVAANVLTGPESGVALDTEGAAIVVRVVLSDPAAHTRDDVRRLYANAAKAIASDLGREVRVVFMSDLGTERGRVSSAVP